LPPIYLAAAGERAAKLAAEIGDGLITTSPKRATVDAFEAAGGAAGPNMDK